MSNPYVHGYDPRENSRLQDQASTLVELLHADTAYPTGSRTWKRAAVLAPKPSTWPGTAQMP